MDNLRHLVNHLKRGERRYFDEFYENTKTGVYFTILKIVKFKETADDLMQDTYLTFLDNVHAVDAEKNVRAYLLSIAKNKALNCVTRNRVTVGLTDYEPVEHRHAMNSDEPLHELCRSRLKPEEWFILEHCVILGYTQVEVARMLHRPATTLNLQLKKILKAVKRLYKEVYCE